MSDRADNQRLLMSFDEQRLVERAERDEQLRQQLAHADRIVESVARPPVH